MHAELGIAGVILMKLDQEITGLALYLFSGSDGVQRRVVRALIDRIKPIKR